jgi:hypothetical protein
MKAFVYLALACLFMAPLAASAQDLASILGTITDASGGAVPGVEVTVSNADQGFTRVVTTDSIGVYAASHIPIGNYTFTVVKAGFENLLRNGITLAAGQTLRLDFQLQVGSTTEKLVVSGNPISVETETGAISHVVTSAQVSELNLQARNFANLATLIPGAATLGTGFDPSSVGV